MQPRALRLAANYTPVGNPGDENAVSAAGQSDADAATGRPDAAHGRSVQAPTNCPACPPGILVSGRSRPACRDLPGRVPSGPDEAIASDLARLKLDGFSPL